MGQQEGSINSNKSGDAKSVDATISVTPTAAAVSAPAPAAVEEKQLQEKLKRKAQEAKLKRLLMEKKFTSSKTTLSNRSSTKDPTTTTTTAATTSTSHENGGDKDNDNNNNNDNNKDSSPTNRGRSSLGDTMKNNTTAAAETATARRSSSTSRDRRSSSRDYAARNNSGHGGHSNNRIKNYGRHHGHHYDGHNHHPYNNGNTSGGQSGGSAGSHHGNRSRSPRRGPPPPFPGPFNNAHWAGPPGPGAPGYHHDIGGYQLNNRGKYDPGRRYYGGGGGSRYGPPPPPLGNHHRGAERPPPSFYEPDQYGRAPRRYHYHPDDNSHRSSRSRSLSRSLSSRSSSRSRSRSYSPSRSPPPPPPVAAAAAVAASRSHSPDSLRSGSAVGKRSRSPDRSTARRKKNYRRRSRRRSPSSSGSSISSSSSSSSSSFSSSSMSSNGNDGTDEEQNGKNTTKKLTAAEYNLTKDQRTVFINQLVMRTTAKDIRNYFRKQVGAKVNDVILLKDKRTGKHKGCAYVELKHMKDVTRALSVSGQPPPFQRFPILIKASEAEKNYTAAAATAATATGTTSDSDQGGRSAPTLASPLIGPNGQPIEAQKVYVGSIATGVTQQHLYQLFSQFGVLNKVSLQVDSLTGISKGYAFLSFRYPKDANLAIQTMATRVLAGRALKTGWATIPSGTPGFQVVTSDEFPEDATIRVQKALITLDQLAMGGVMPVASPPQSVANMASAAVDLAMGTSGISNGVSSAVQHAASIGSAAAARIVSQIAAAPLSLGALPTTAFTSASKVPTVAEARQSLAAANAATTSAVPIVLATPDAKIIGRSENPSPHLLVHNMYDKDEETEPGWAEEIRLEFEEECSKFGSILRVLVMSNDPGGKIYASFDSNEAAQKCASSLAGRWFDKRQLRVQFVDEDEIPEEA